MVHTLVGVSLCEYILHFAAVRLKAPWKHVNDRVENPGDLCTDLCFSCSTELKFLCFHFHFSCHTLLKMNVVIFTTVTFVIAQKWSTSKQRASQCDLLEWKMFPWLENHTWGATPLSNTMFKSWENIRCKKMLGIKRHFYPCYNFVMSD